MNKFNIGENVFTLNMGCELQFILNFKITEISKKFDGIIYYSENGLKWFPEETVFKSCKDAYQFIINKAQNELKNYILKDAYSKWNN